MSATEGAIHTPPAEHGDYASSGEPGRPAAGLPHSERAGHPRRPGGWSARITRRHLVVTLGLIWLLDGLLQLQPYMYTPTFAGDTMQYMTMGRPNLVTDLIAVATRLTYSTLDRQAAYNTLAAVLQIAIGIGLIWYRTERPALIGSALWGLGPWIVGEGLGGMIFPQASMAIGGAPGAAVIYSLLSIVLWPRRPIDTAAEWSAADSGLLGRRGALVMWAVIWFGTALLELEHSNWAPGSVAAQLRTQAEGQVAWIAALEHAAAHLTAGHGTEVALAMLVVQSWVGVAVLRRATRKAALVVGIVVHSSTGWSAKSLEGSLREPVPTRTWGPSWCSTLACSGRAPRTSLSLVWRPIPSTPRWTRPLPPGALGSVRGPSALAERS